MRCAQSADVYLSLQWNQAVQSPKIGLGGGKVRLHRLKGCRLQGADAGRHRLDMSEVVFEVVERSLRDTNRPERPHASDAQLVHEQHQTDHDSRAVATRVAGGR